jgi:two-component system response regulator HydG
VPLVAIDDQAHAGFRAVLLFDADSRRVAGELLQVQQQGFPRRELGPLLEAARRVYHPGRILGVSAGMIALRERVMEAARASEHVLVRGPAGTGKEFVARTLHFGGNCTGFLVPLDCGARSEIAQADAVFGRVKTSVEGSLGDHPGLLHQAHQGTLFLGRVEALSLEVQAGLLRAIERGEVCRVGSEDVERVEVRVIASSCADLRERVSEGSFLGELHSRLCAVELVLPALRDRPDDVEVLAHVFADGSPVSHTRPAFSRKALAALLAHDWPGNVRELKECVEQACTLAGGGEIGLEHLPLHVCAAEPQAPPASAGGGSESQGLALGEVDVEVTPQAPCDLNLKSYERQCLLAALSETGGDKLAAARLLQVGKSTLYRKLKLHRIT